MFGSSAGQVSLGFSTNNSGPIGGGAYSKGNSSFQVPSICTTACSTSNPSYQAATSNSSNHGGSSSANYKSNKASSQPTHSYSSNYGGSSNHISSSHNSNSKFAHSSASKYNSPTNNSAKWANQSSKGLHSSTVKHSELSKKNSMSKKPRSHSVNPHSYNYPNSNFIQLLPVSTQFPNPNTLPQSMKNMSVTDQVVNFYPVQRKGRNYLKYCNGWLSNKEKPDSIAECVLKYTSGPNWFCTEVNMALASDSPNLKSYGPYIRQLKYSIGMSRMRFAGTVFRGADMSPIEINAYETSDIFFIPSFTSTSKSMPFKNKNTLFHIDISPEWSKFCMEIRSKHTKYAAEEEILFSCYNLYQYQRTEKSNGQRIIKLHLMNYDRYFDYRKNTILYHA